MDLQFRTSLLKASAFFLLITGFCPSAVSAMGIAMYDRMAIQDQQAYLKFLVKDVQKVFSDEGLPEMAAKVQQLFRNPPGARLSVGEARFAENVTRMRSVGAEPGGIRFRFSYLGEIETALMTTLVMNGITPSTELGRNLAQLLREKPYWPKLPLRTS
jgi:hypothetical protein